MQPRMRAGHRTRSTPAAAVCGKRGGPESQAAHARNHARNDRRGERVYGAQAHPTEQYLLDIIKILGTHRTPTTQALEAPDARNIQNLKT